MIKNIIMHIKYAYMSFPGEASDEQYWVEIGGNGRMHPYGMHKTVNQRTLDVVNYISSSNNHPLRWVFVRNGAHEAWVIRKYRDEYGYPLQPEERVSDAELDAITIKHRAINDGNSVTHDDISEVADLDDPDVLQHVIVARYYVAKADPAVPDDELDHLREQLHNITGHADASHVQTDKRILNDHLKNDG